MNNPKALAILFILSLLTTIVVVMLVGRKMKVEYFKESDNQGDIFPLKEHSGPELPEDQQSTDEVELETEDAVNKRLATLVAPYKSAYHNTSRGFISSIGTDLSEDEIKLQEEAEMILGDTPGLKDPKAICVTNEDCNVIFGDGNNVCSVDGVCVCKEGSGEFCHMGPTNYKDPKEMTPHQRSRFKGRFRPDFSLQDYKNWLSLYKEDRDPDNLSPEHESNFEKLRNGIALVAKDIPKINLGRRLTVADKFMTVNRNRFSLIPFPFVNDGEDNDIQDTGTVFQNPRHIGTKFIDLVEKLPKRSAKKLRQYLGPSPTESADSRNFKF